MLLIHCLVLFPLFEGLCVWSLLVFRYVVLSVVSSFAIIFVGKRGLVALRLIVFQDFS